MNTVEHLVKIHNVSTSNEVTTIMETYIRNGFKVTKVETIENNKYIFYLEQINNKSYYLFLDDERMPKNVTWINLPSNVDWVIVRNYNQFVDYVEKHGLPKHISYDHDLAEIHYKKSIILNRDGGTYEYSATEEKTGYDCAKWMIEYCRKRDLNHPSYSVHSMSVVGKENIIKYIENYKLWRINFK
jgi:hypothetical protein